MNQKGYLRLYTFMALILIVSLACTGGVATPTPQVPLSNPPTRPAQPVQPVQPSNNSSSGLKTFTDQNDLYQIDVPANWTHSQTTGEYYYADILLSPDEAVKVENIVYNDGKPFSGSQNGKFALNLLHKFYSSTGEQGDIRVTDDAIMDDGSERLTWVSRGGGYSGVSFFEVRGDDRSTFLMFTIYWLDEAEGQYQDTVDNVIASYHVP